jgi:hypothetical protein
MKAIGFRGAGPGGGPGRAQLRGGQEGSHQDATTQPATTAVAAGRIPTLASGRCVWEPIRTDRAAGGKPQLAGTAGGQ